MATIEKQTAVALSQSWGVSFSDYKVNGTRVDFQDLMIAISEKRAVTVEGEVTPLTTRIKTRNTELDKLGSLLAIFTKAQANFASDAKGSDTTAVSGITSDQWALLREAYIKRGGDDPGATWRPTWANDNWSKSSIEGLIQALKSMIDTRNNQAQTDMTRLQSLVDRRDESYSTASNLMSAVSDTRSNLIRNL
ncbi:MAG: hypothetical protein IJU44_03975 [Kiritimatiellae bacterium]|nr:hypothetical protein [Kiritimatiellia bacterium]